MTVDKKLSTRIDTNYLIHQIWISTNFWCCSFLSLPWLPLVLSQSLYVLAVHAGEEFTGSSNPLANSWIFSYFFIQRSWCSTWPLLLGCWELSSSRVYNVSEKQFLNLTTISVAVELGFQVWSFKTQCLFTLSWKFKFYKSLMTWLPRFLRISFQPLTSWRLSEAVWVTILWMQGCVIQVILMQSRHWGTNTAHNKHTCKRVAFFLVS